MSRVDCVELQSYKIVSDRRLVNVVNVLLLQPSGLIDGGEFTSFGSGTELDRFKQLQQGCSSMHLQLRYQRPEPSQKISSLFSEVGDLKSDSLKIPQVKNTTTIREHV